jgi:MGT family glycosyltransferase
MARFLFVVPPLVGHTNPTVSVAQALEARGHEVAWVAHPGVVRPLLPEGATLFALDDQLPAERWNAATAASRAVRGLAALKFLWEEFFIPLARAMVPGVEDAIDRFRPDVLVVDQQAVAGALVARRRGLPWATFATTSAGLTDPLAGLPLVRAWLDDQLATLEREAGLEPIPEPDRSPRLVVAFSTHELAGPPDRFPAHYRFVGPSIHARREITPFPWDELRPGPRVLVSLGTVNAEAGERFYATVIDALGDDGRASPPRPQVILVAPDRLVSAPPPNVLVRPFVPQLALLPKVDAVVSHGGHNTVCESLAHGLPLVVLPIKDDQPVVAQQVVDAGAGLRLKFGRVRPDELREAVRRVLEEPGFRAAAARIQRSFAAAGGALGAAELLEGLR